VNDIVYSIERSDNIGKHTKVLLYNNTNNINLTGKSIPETYKVLQTLLGSYEQFAMTGLYYDMALDIIKVGKSDRIGILSELLGLPDTESIKKKIKADMNIVDRKIHLLDKPRGDVSIKVLEDKQELYRKYTKLSKSVQDHQNSVVMLKTTLSNNEDRLAELLADLSKYQGIRDINIGINKDISILKKKEDDIKSKFVLEKKEYDELNLR
jgi:hypothetical protein